MRTWIIFSTLIVCETLSPEQKFETIIAIAIIVFMVVGGILDYIEIKNKL